MHALMGKSSKAPTPQEIYRARKQKEEDERTAFLPPGLVNHGNTCFMNSVLQGLMATPMLADILRFSLPDTYAPVFSRRSPQLTNGHGLGGKAERAWEEGMPLGDAFVLLMEKAWKAQDERQRWSMSPRDLLTRIGAKFDQYLDFRQQDAHEFLRHLLDAMRMEELDIIKQRQPPPPKAKRKRKNKNADDTSSLTSLPGPSNIPEEDRLVSFVDMVFGGRLASILVCEKCKKVSCTYEDFNDLSLSIKQEDYEKARKRDRLRSLARKLGMRGRGASRELDVPDGPRSSSVPSSPLRRSEEAERSFELVFGDVGHRRRSLEVGEETPSLGSVLREEVQLESGDTPVERSTKDERRTLGVLDERKPLEEEDLQKEEPRREKEEDGWIKMRRKISVGMGVKKGRKKGVSKEAPPDLPASDEGQADATGDEAVDSFVDVKAPSPLLASPAASPLLGASITLPKFPFVRRSSSSRTENNSPAISALTTPSRSPEIPSVALPPPEIRPSSPSPAPTEHSRPKSPRPPKPTRSESVYLRRLLADVPASSSTPFNLFRTGALANSSPEISDTRGAWPKFGHVQSVEGCLRMFTAVEVLDGENMVGCRRCWKIQNGKYVPREKEAVKEDEDEDEDEDPDDDDDGAGSSSSASIKISLVDGDESQPQEPPTSSTSPQSSSLDLNEGRSLRSVPSSVLNGQLLENDDAQRVENPAARTSSSPVLAVPLISMTAPETTPVASEETPIAGVPSESATRSDSSVKLVSSASQDSLRLPMTRHFRQPAERHSSLSMASDTSSLSSDESGDEAEETETSLTASVRSDSSSVASTQLEAGISKTSALSSSFTEHTSDPSLSSSRAKTNGGVPRAKQVVMRRAYKRYLIATPPPVLVVHLKRFQQVGRGPTQYQFFANFKKLDDPVSFPEYLDLNPFLLPSKDEREMKKRKGKTKEEKDEKRGYGRRVKDPAAGAESCMYRLYAVVVHIGNMLGGHYVAYTALPETAPAPSPSDDKDGSSSLSSSAHLDLARPEIPRTTSFTRTANPFPSSKSRTSSSGSSAQRQWCYVSDTVVRLASLEEVLQAKAYICMYERV